MPPTPSSRNVLRCVFLFVALLALPVATRAQQFVAEHFVGTWATALTDERKDHLTPQLDDTILVQTVRVSAAGEGVRLRLSNFFGESELVIASATLALLSDGELNATTVKAEPVALRFGGRPGITLPAGGTASSDAIAFRLPQLSDVVITLHIKKAPETLTSHATANAQPVSFYRAASIEAARVKASDFQRAYRWYFISGLDAAPESSTAAATDYEPRAIVALGDSITDGWGVPPAGNQRWPDELSRRLRTSPSTATVGVLNMGISGNRLLHEGRGPSALERFERDVLQQTAVRWVILLIGINDLGQAAGARAAGKPYPTAADLIAGYKQLIDRAHAADIKVYASPILPYKKCFYWSPEGEADRKAINQWIRESGDFDAVIDLDAAVRDPSDPDYFAQAYDLGDFLHPNPDGLTEMGRAIDLSLFAEGK